MSSVLLNNTDLPNRIPQVLPLDLDNEPTRSLLSVATERDTAAIKKIVSSYLYEIALQERKPEPKIQFFLAAKGDPCAELPDYPNSSDYRGPPLYRAFQMRASNETIDLLVNAKADLSQLDERRAQPPYLFMKELRGEDLKGVRFLRILTGSEKMKAIDSCKNAHDFFNLLFPSYTDVLPPGWESIVSDISKEVGISVLENWVKDHPGQSWPLIGDIVNALDYFAKKSGRTTPYPIQFIFDVLTLMHPLFETAWNAMNPKPELYEIQQLQAHYFVELHKICIGEHFSNREKIGALVFETMNAFQANAFKKTPKLQKREEAALATEFVERNSDFWRGKMVYDRGYQQSFLEYWKSANLPGSSHIDPSLPHTEDYRREWDVHSGLQYLFQNKGEVQKRLAELEKEPSEFKSGALK